MRRCMGTTRFFPASVYILKKEHEQAEQRRREPDNNDAAKIDRDIVYLAGKENPERASDPSG